MIFSTGQAPDFFFAFISMLIMKGVIFMSENNKNPRKLSDVNQIVAFNNGIAVFENSTFKEFVDLMFMEAGMFQAILTQHPEYGDRMAMEIGDLLMNDENK